LDAGSKPAIAVSSTEKNVPDAEIVHDKFHVSKYLNEAVDKVRRQENKKLLSEGDEQLKGTRQMWLFNEENLDEDRLAKLEAAIDRDLQTGVAWSIKENFREFWDYTLSTTAEKFFEHWYTWAKGSELSPIKKVADMLNRHLDGLLSYFRYSITNAVTEGFNSRIQSIKSAARGFRCFENYRARILFYCGKLDLMPNRRH
jgi:transposase